MIRTPSVTTSDPAHNGEYHPTADFGVEPLLRISGITAFFTTCLAGCSGMLALVRHGELLVRWPVAVFFLGSGLVMAWLVLQRWRVISPVRCALALGICSALAGAGAYILFLYALIP